MFEGFRTRMAGFFTPREDGSRPFGPYVVPIGLIALGVAVIIEAATTLRYYNTTGPASGFFPTWLSVILIAGGIALVVLQLRGLIPDDGESPGEMRPLLKSVSLVIAGMLLVPLIGMTIPLGLIFFGQSWWVERNRLWRSALVAVIVAVLMHFTFFVLLGVRQPHTLIGL